MKISLVSIGDEILLGDILNTNSQFLSRELRRLGYIVSSHIVLKDDEKLLKGELRRLLEENDLVITTGGLGPTFDDKTKNVIADIFSLPIEYDREVFEDLKKRFKEDRYVKSQAYVPKGAIVLKNELGTAPSFIVEGEGALLIALPGVPHEMERVFFSLADYLRKKFPPEKVYKEDLALVLLRENDVEPFLEELRSLGREVEIGIYPALALLRVSFKGKREDVSFLKERFFKKFQDYILKEETLLDSLKGELESKGERLALAESCTGGAVASFITKSPGASSYFLGAVVCYSNEIKRDVLGVSQETLEEKGAVSEETVSEMVRGIFNITDADYAIAISGIAGPGGGSVKKPVGTVCVAVAKRGEKVDRGVIHVPKDRGFIINYLVNFSLAVLYLRIRRGFFYFKNF